MQLKGTAFYQHRFKCLDTQTVQCGRTVQQNRMVMNDIFQSIPYFCGSTVYHLSGALDIGNDLCIDQTLQYEGLEQFQCHFLRQTALIHFQFRANDDYRTAGVVYTFPQQILTETTLFTLQHI